MRVAILTALLAALVLGVPSAGAAELVEIPIPSDGAVDPATMNVADDHPRELRAMVRLPDDHDPDRAYPLLLLLHGAGDRWDAWARPDRGDIMRTAGGLDAITVMPEGARGFYTDWWNEGRRGDPAWERYILDEVVAEVERRWRIRPERRHRAIAGLSMGGFGAAYLASQAPGSFGTALVISGFVSVQRPEIEIGLSLIGGVDYGRVFGPQTGFYAEGHNPVRLAGNLRHTRTIVRVGNGIAEPGVPVDPVTGIGGGGLEAFLKLQNDEFVDSLHAAGAPVDYRVRLGVHDWPYYRRALTEAIGLGLFRPVAEDPGEWTLRTVRSRGQAWGLDFELAEPPDGVVELERQADRLLGRGPGRVRVENRGGCGFEADLPFDRPFPPRACERLRVQVSPSRVRRGSARTFRFRVTAPRGGNRVPVEGATVRLGRRSASTGPDGRARIRARLAGRPGLRRPGATSPDHLTGRARLRVVR